MSYEILPTIGVLTGLLAVGAYATAGINYLVYPRPRVVNKDKYMEALIQRDNYLDKYGKELKEQDENRYFEMIINKYSPSSLSSHITSQDD